MNLFKSLVSIAMVFSMLFLNIAPALALGEVTVETNIVVESAPEPTPVPELISTPSVTEPTPEVSNVTAPVIETIVAGDTTPPHVSSILAISVLPTAENISWTTDELATSRLEYGTTLSYGSSVTLSATAGLVHLAVLIGLTPSTRYYYCIHSTDLAGNNADSCGHEFTTEVEASVLTGITTSGSGENVNNNIEHLVDTSAPDISLVSVTSIDTTNATINWTTSEVANAEVEYGTTAGYGNATTLDTSLSLNHSVTLHNLTANTEYHYRIRTADEIGNTTVSPDNTFTTDSVGDSNLSLDASVLISGVETASVSSTGVTITWTTDLPSDSQVEYGDSQNLGSLSTLNTTLTTSHSVTLSNLSENTNYVFRVKSKPVGASVVVASSLHEFTTLTHSTPVIASANISSVASSNVTASGATIIWTTDKGTTSQVEYGLSTGYGEQSTQNTNLTMSHSMALSNLDQQTTYHYRVKSTDSADNVTFSDDHTFTTLSNNQPVSAPASVSTLAVGAYDQSSTVLAWHVVSSNADVSLEYDVRYSTSPITESNYVNTTEAQLTSVYHSDLNPEGTKREYIVAGLSPNTTYYFAIKSKHQHSDWSSISNVVSIKTTTGASINSGYGGGSGGGLTSPTTGNEEGSFEPTTLKAEPADGQVIFEWNNPGESNFVRTVIVRKEGSYPTSPSDGQTIYEGRGQTFTDTNVTNNTTYYYALYSYNHSKTYSSPVRVSLAPKVGNDQVKFNETGSLIPFSPVMHFTRVYKRKDKSIEIEHLQEILALEDVSFPENLVTGYFGLVTEKALKQFQAKYGLAQSGVIDVATQVKLNSVTLHEKKLEVTGDIALFDTDLKLGSQGEVVKDLQEFLVYEGSYPEAQISGRFGSLTKNAVMRFQKKYGITPVSGFVGYKTRHRMQQLTGL